MMLYFPPASTNYDAMSLSLSLSFYPAPADCGDDDLLLQFDFESGFKDSCINSPLIQKGTTDVTQELQKGNNVACFDGTSSMEVRCSHCRTLFTLSYVVHTVVLSHTNNE